MGAKEKDEATKNKIQLIIKLLVIKIDNLENEFLFGPKSIEIRQANKFTLETCQKEFQ
jgi:hypothetical protein